MRGPLHRHLPYECHCRRGSLIFMSPRVPLGELIGLVSIKMRLSGDRSHEYGRKTCVTVANCNEVDTLPSANLSAAERAC